MSIKGKNWFQGKLLSLFSTTILFLLLGNVCAQNPKSSNEIREKVIELSNNYLKQNDYASGVITRISYPDSLEFTHTNGYKNKEEYNTLKGNEQFIAASITKTFVAVCILQQVEENLIALDDKVMNYVDKEVLRKLTTYKGRSYENELTVEHLLRHKSGIVDYLNQGEVHINGLNNEPNRSYTLQERLDFALELGDNTATNRLGKYNYSNTNYILLGIIAEKIDQMEISNIFQNRIIEALELKNTSLSPPDSVAKEMFNGYYEDRDLTEFTLAFNKDNPAAGVLTNVDDLVTFARAVFRGDLFKSDRTLELMLDFEDGYGLGIMKFGKSRKTGKIMGHSGYDPGYTSYLVYLENIDACIVTVINQSELRIEMPAYLVVKIVALLKEFL